MCRRPGADDLIAVTQRAGKNMDALSTHLSALRRPEMVPAGIVRSVWNARVKSSLFELPALFSADRL